MIKTSLFKILMLLIFTFTSCQSQNKHTTNQKVYTFKKGDQNGIGKWYLGREIAYIMGYEGINWLERPEREKEENTSNAYIMGYEGINWLERPEREKEENTSKLIKNMNIQPTDIIADIGAGSGYHVFKMAPLANKGAVYAVDIQPEMLQAILGNNQYKINKNIELVQGNEKSVNLPKNTFDKV